MKKSFVIGIVLIALVIVGIFLFSNLYKSPGQQGNTQTDTGINPFLDNTSVPSENTNPGVTAQTFDVMIQNMAFSPQTVTINVGDTVVWTNKDSVSHTVTSDSGAELGSNSLSKSGTYSHTFTMAGTYKYHCAIHTSMKGTIIVQ